VGQADRSPGDGTLAPYPGLAATLAHGMDFFDRPSGVLIPQIASSLTASLGEASADGAQDWQARGMDQDAAAPSSITSSRLSENQRPVHFELEHSGGRVVGAGKPDFPGGMQYPPTKAKIIRDP